MTALPSASELAILLADRIDALVPELLPGARRTGGYWQAGNVEGDAGSSLYIHRNGPKVGQWTDAATGQFGDALDLVNHALFGGSDMRASIKWASGWLGLDPANPKPTVPAREVRPKPHEHDGDEAAIAAARNIWSAAQPIAGTLGERYLRSRSIGIELPPTLRFAPALQHHPTGLALPALVAAISGPDQKVTAVQRIFLRLDGRGKAGVSDPKLTLGRMRDGACRLAPAGPALALAEGIETAASAAEIHRIPVWAACGSRMDVIAIPDGVERLAIFADRGTAGERAAERAEIAHRRPGRRIEIVEPPQPHKDWNDVARAAADGTAAA